MSLEGIFRSQESQPLPEATKAHTTLHKSNVVFSEINVVFSPDQKKTCLAACKANSQVQLAARDSLGAIYNTSQISLAEEIVRGIMHQPDAVKHKFWQAMAKIKVDSEKTGDADSLQEELFQLCEQGDYEALAHCMPSIDSIGDVASILLTDEKKARLLHEHLTKQGVA